MHTSISPPDICTNKPWLNLDSHVKNQPAKSTVDSILKSAKLPILEKKDCIFEAFKLTGLGRNQIATSILTDSEVESFRDEHKKAPREKRKSERVVIFLEIDSKLRDQLLHADISLFPNTGTLSSELTQILKKIGIDEERLVRVVNLSATGRYTSEKNDFASFCIPEHTIINQDLDKIQRISENQAARIFKTNLINIIYNRDLTIIIHNGESPTVNRLALNLRDGQMEDFKSTDLTPCVTTLIKDIIEANSIACQRVLRTFHQFKLLPFRAHDTSIVAAFKMVLAELQNYVVTQEDPVSSMERLLKGIASDSQNLNSLLNRPKRFNELLEHIQLTTQKTLQLDRALTLREDARRAGVETRSQYISATLAALGSAFLPNATITQLPIGDWKLQLAAHAVATLFSFCLLVRMHKLGWFDFVTENFGDLFGLEKIKKLIFGEKGKST